jgi:hypothetical protein
VIPILIGVLIIFIGLDTIQKTSRQR